MMEEVRLRLAVSSCLMSRVISFTLSSDSPARTCCGGGGGGDGGSGGGEGGSISKYNIVVVLIIQLSFIIIKDSIFACRYFM